MELFIVLFLYLLDYKIKNRRMRAEELTAWEQRNMRIPTPQ